MTAQPIRPLLDLPADVQKVSFVMSLGRAINDPAGTFERYAVTPAMVRNFREALGQVKGALDSGRGQPVFLRGAFGSGKSHFMAALTHLIAGAPEALSHEKLHELVDLAKAVASKRLLQLHFHMLDKKSLEQAIFGGYIERVRALHPDAPAASARRGRVSCPRTAGGVLLRSRRCCRWPCRPACSRRPR
jgi:hypothetical protein